MRHKRMGQFSAGDAEVVVSTCDRQSNRIIRGIATPSAGHLSTISYFLCDTNVANLRAARKFFECRPTTTTKLSASCDIPIPAGKQVIASQDSNQEGRKGGKQETN